MGNAKGRFKAREEAERNRSPVDVLLQEEIGPAPRGHRSGPMSKNQKKRSLQQRLAHLRKKRDEYARRPGIEENRWAQMILDDYDKEIAHCENGLQKLGLPVA